MFSQRIEDYKRKLLLKRNALLPLHYRRYQYCLKKYQQNKTDTNKIMHYALFQIKTNLRTKEIFLIFISIVFQAPYAAWRKISVPPSFLTKFSKPSHNYPTFFSAHNFLVPASKLEKSSYKIYVIGLVFSNNILAAAKRS